MTYLINSYFAILLITVAGAGATMFIVHVAYDDSLEVSFTSTGANYASLQETAVTR